MLALGRTPAYWYTLAGLAVLLAGMVGGPYLLAGCVNRIPGRVFFALDWRSPALLAGLLSREEGGYTADWFNLRD